MDNNIIATKRKNIHDNLHGRHLKIVFDELRKLTRELNNGQLNDKLDLLETTYKYMIKYMFEGVVDPQREKLYRTLICDLYEISDIIFDKLLTQSSSLHYYGKKRYYALSGVHSLPTALKKLQDAWKKLSAAQEEDAVVHLVKLRNEMEMCQEELFAQLLVDYPSTAESCEAAKQTVNTTVVDKETACIAVSAITLGVINNYDERKISILADAYTMNTDEEIRQRALCGLLILLYIYRDRVTLSDTLNAQIAAMCEDVRFCRDVRNQFIQFIRTMETERISDIFTREILPEMMKIAPGLRNKISSWDQAGDAVNPTDINPEWEDLLANSPISKRLKELNDLQIEGADVLITTFSSLKSFPFFSRMANWFRPFNKNNSEISGAFEGLGNLSDIIDASRFMCNSDKYSLALAVTHLPTQQRDMMINQLPGEKQDVADMFKNEADGESSIAKNISNQYIQDLYRFFKLSPGDFRSRDIFAEHINLPESELLSPIFEDEETLRLTGEFYLKKGYYGYAVNYFAKLSQKEPDDAVLYQKTGYCKQMMKDYEGAIAEYKKADSIASGFWTLQHLASANRYAGHLKEAFDYYLEALQINPDNLSVEMQCGHCLLAMEKYEEALKHYFKVEYLTDGNGKAWRPIAWCSFLTGKLTQAENYYARILQTTPTSEDYLNAGHVAFVAKQLQKACEYYLKSIEMQNGDIAKFNKAFNQDREILQNSGIDENEISIMLDNLEYMSAQKQDSK